MTFTPALSLLAADDDDAAAELALEPTLATLLLALETTEETLDATLESADEAEEPGEVAVVEARVPEMETDVVVRVVVAFPEEEVEEGIGTSVVVVGPLEPEVEAITRCGRSGQCAA